MALYPAALLHCFVPRAQALLRHIALAGETASFAGLIDLPKINEVLGADDLLES